LAALITGVVGPAFLAVVGPGVASAAIAALPTCIFAILYLTFLSTLSNRELVYYLTATFILVGVFMLGINQMSVALNGFLSALLFVVAWLSLHVLLRGQSDAIYLVGTGPSKERRQQGRKNSLTLFIVGCMSGAVAILPHFVSDIVPGTMPQLSGICLGVAAAVFFLSHIVLAHKSGGIAKRTLALSLAAPLLLFSFMDTPGRMFSIGLLLVLGIINLMFIIDAIAETARFNQISPFYLVGLEGAIFVSGTVFSFLLIGLSVWLTQQIAVAAIILTVLSSIMQVYINSQHYPLFLVDDGLTIQHLPGSAPTGMAKEVSDKPPDEEANLQKSAFWHIKIEAIAKEYNLSERQKEILELLAKGRNTSYITKHFYISRSTAKTHIYNLYRKINIHSREELLNLIEKPLNDSHDQLSP
jgi:DNA-binding CsgD family transcriptional regulator